MKPAGLVIFDIDGTLFQAGLVTAPAIRKSLESVGVVPPSVESIAAWYGKPVEPYHAWLASLCPSEVAARVIADADRYELEFIATEGRLYPGALDALAELRAQGYLLATSSNAPDDYFDAVMDSQGLRACFELPLCRGTRFADKTAIVGEILTRLQARPVVVVGDRADDVESAHAHGAFALASCYGFGSREELCEADAFADDLRDVPAAVDRLVSSRVR
ncbi:MAG: HAD family hydrolase [Candidatus Hydrogenedentales bacterium]